MGVIIMCLTEMVDALPHRVNNKVAAIPIQFPPTMVLNSTAKTIGSISTPALEDANHGPKAKQENKLIPSTLAIMGIKRRDHIKCRRRTSKELSTAASVGSLTALADSGSILPASATRRITHTNHDMRRNVGCVVLFKGANLPT
ncbi:hypothetical protein ACNPN0_15685 [Glutamicibacter sp. AGC84]